PLVRAGHDRTGRARHHRARGLTFPSGQSRARGQGSDDMTDTRTDGSPWKSPPFPFVYEINTWPWLHELSAAAGHDISLGTVPEEQWDAIAAAGFDAVWLMGVWERSPAGVAIALANPDLLASFEAALPGYEPADVVGSPYCIRDYVVDAHLGGPAGLAS